MVQDEDHLLTKTDASSRTSGGLFDGFEGYVTPHDDDYRKVFTEGMVAIDANVLLNLYRYTVEARDDLLSVLDSIRDNLWLPNQVVTEFWRNRERVLRDPRDTEKTAGDLSKLRERTTQILRAWANRVSLPRERADELIETSADSFAHVIESVEQFADSSARSTARDTNNDPIIQRLGTLLAGRVGPKLDPDEQSAAVKEGMRRVAEQQPPGYRDAGKDAENAASDYLVWEQLLVETELRRCDVLFVTADVKDDWWRREAGEPRGPRIELAEEMRVRTDRRLFMLRPPQLLNYARRLLEIPVSEQSVKDADRIDKLISQMADLAPGGWTDEALAALLERLAQDSPIHERVMRLMARQDGYVSREQVYEIGNYPPHRTLRGFTRPINRIAQELRDDFELSDDSVDLIRAVYGDESPKFGWAAGFQMHEDVLPLLIDVIESGQAASE